MIEQIQSWFFKKKKTNTNPKLDNLINKKRGGGKPKPSIKYLKEEFSGEWKLIIKTYFVQLWK